LLFLSPAPRPHPNCLAPCFFMNLRGLVVVAGIFLVPDFFFFYPLFLHRLHFTFRFSAPFEGVGVIGSLYLFISNPFARFVFEILTARKNYFFNMSLLFRFLSVPTFPRWSVKCRPPLLKLYPENPLRCLFFFCMAFELFFVFSNLARFSSAFLLPHNRDLPCYGVFSHGPFPLFKTPWVKLFPPPYSWFRAPMHHHLAPKYFLP